MAELDQAAGNSEQFTLAQPRTAQEWEGYFDLRWRVLREPWGQPRGTERDALDAESLHLFAGDAAGAVAAVGRLQLNSPAEAQVRYMAVDKTCCGHGLGSRILSGLEDRARSEDVTRIVLNARDNAINFYRRHGYKVEGLGDILFGKVRHFRTHKLLAASQ